MDASDVHSILQVSRQALFLLSSEEINAIPQHILLQQRKEADEKLTEISSRPDAWDVGINLINFVLCESRSQWNGHVMNDAELALYLGFKFMRESVRPFKKGKKIDPRWNGPSQWGKEFLINLIQHDQSMENLCTHLSRQPIKQLAALLGETIIATYGISWNEAGKQCHALFQSGHRIGVSLGLEICNELAEAMVILEADASLGARRKAIDRFWDETVFGILNVMRLSFEMSDESVLINALSTLAHVINATSLTKLETESISVTDILQQCTANFKDNLEDSDFRQVILSSLVGIFHSSVMKNNKKIAYSDLPFLKRQNFLRNIIFVFEALYPPTEPFSYEDDDLTLEIPLWTAIREFVDKNAQILLEDGKLSQDPAILEYRLNLEQFIRRIVLRGVCHRYSYISAQCMQSLTVFCKKTEYLISDSHDSQSYFALWGPIHNVVFALFLRMLRIWMLAKESNSDAVDVFLTPLLLIISEGALATYLSPDEIALVKQNDNLLDIAGQTLVTTDGSSMATLSQDDEFESSQMWATLKSSVGGLVQSMVHFESVRMDMTSALKALRLDLLNYKIVPMNPMANCPVLSAVEGGHFKPSTNAKFHMWLSPAFIIFDSFATIHESMLMKVWSFIRKNLNDESPHKDVHIPPYPLELKPSGIPQWALLMMVEVMEISNWVWNNGADKYALHIEARRLDMIGHSGSLLYWCHDAYSEGIEFRTVVLKGIFTRVDAPYEKLTGPTADVYGTLSTLSPAYCMRRSALYCLMRLIETIPSAFNPIAEDLATKINNRLNDYSVENTMREQEKNLLTEAFICIVNATGTFAIQAQFSWDLIKTSLEELHTLRNELNGPDKIISVLFGSSIVRTRDNEEALLLKRRDVTRVLGQIDVIFKRIKLPHKADDLRKGGFHVSYNQINTEHPYRLNHPLEAAMGPLLDDLMPILRCWSEVCETFESLSQSMSFNQTVEGKILQTFFSPGDEEVQAMTGSINHVVRSTFGLNRSIDHFVASEDYEVVGSNQEEKDDYIIIGRRHVYHLRTLILKIIGRIFDHSPKAMIESNVMPYIIKMIGSADVRMLASINEMYTPKAITDTLIAGLLVPPPPIDLTTVERAPCRCYLVDRSAPWIRSTPLNIIVSNIRTLITTMQQKINSIIECLQIEVSGTESDTLSDYQWHDRTFRIGCLNKALNQFTMTLQKLVSYKNTVTGTYAKFLIPAPDCKTPAENEENQFTYENETFDHQRALNEAKRLCYVRDSNNEESLCHAIFLYGLSILGAPIPGNCREAHILLRTISKISSKQFTPPLDGIELVLHEIFQSVLRKGIIQPPMFEPIPMSLGKGRNNPIEPSMSGELAVSGIIMHSPVLDYLRETGTAADDGSGGSHITNVVNTLFETINAMTRVAMTRNIPEENKTELIAGMMAVLLELPEPVDNVWLENLINDAINNDVSNNVAYSKNAQRPRDQRLGSPKQDHSDMSEYRIQLRHLIKQNIAKNVITEGSQLNYLCWIQANQDYLKKFRSSQ